MDNYHGLAEAINYILFVVAEVFILVVETEVFETNFFENLFY